MKRIIVLVLLLAIPAFAGYRRLDEMVKPPPGAQQAFPDLQVITAPAATSTTYVLAATGNTSTSATKTVSAGITSPDVPRNVTVTTGGTTADCAAGNVVVTGTDFFGKALTENLAITNAQNGTTTGAKAFRTVSSVTLPAEQGTAACTFALGIGSKLGLSRCLDQAGYVFQATLNGVREATFPTVANSASAVSGNTVTLSSSLNGNDVAVMYFQNYRCTP